MNKSTITWEGTMDEQQASEHRREHDSDGLHHDNCPACLQRRRGSDTFVPQPQKAGW